MARPPDPPSAFQIQQLTPVHRQAWDNYVLNFPASTVYHLLGMKDAMEDSYGTKTIYLFVLNSLNKVTGVLPLAVVRLPWFTDALVSLPYSNYGGALADCNAVATALLREAESIRTQLGLGCLMVKGLSHADLDAFTNEQVQYSMVLDTNCSFESVWAKSFTKSCRNHCNRAARLGVRIELGTDEKLLHDFYTLYVDQQHRFGTPMHSLKWYQRLLLHLNNHVLFAVAYLGQIPVAAVCAHIYRNRMISNNSARHTAFSATGANNLLRSELIRHACSSGIALFDFSRAKCDSGTYHFKCSFGARPTATYYQYVVAPGASTPATEPNDRFFRLPAQIWRHLPRSWVLRIGPSVRKRLAT